MRSRNPRAQEVMPCRNRKVKILQKLGLWKDFHFEGQNRKQEGHKPREMAKIPSCVSQGLEWSKNVCQGRTAGLFLPQIQDEVILAHGLRNSKLRHSYEY